MKSRLLGLSLLMLAGVAHAQGYPPATVPLTDNAGQVTLCPSTAQPTKNCKLMGVKLPDLATYMISKVPATGAVKVLVVPGNNTGTYNVSGITASNTLIAGFAISDNLASTAFNYSPLSFLLVGAGINPTAGWKTGAGTIIDPTTTDWTVNGGFSLVWIYQ